jgi:hypothetical protein
VTPAGQPEGAGPRSIVFRDAAGRALALGELVRSGPDTLACPHVVFPWAVGSGAAEAPPGAPRA